MLRLHRPPQCPQVLETVGYKKTQALCDLYEESEPHRSGKEPFPFDDTYRDLSIRRSLEVAQHGKCGYCEAIAPPLEVEHYRPKSASRQARDQVEQKPGYYWLAYEWQNLLLACVLCNQPRTDTDGSATGKGTLFPLANPSERARSHHEALAQEQPLLLDPYEDDPDQHIGYRQHMPLALTLRGQATIDALRLQSKDQQARRVTLWETIARDLRLLESEELPEQYRQEIIEELWKLADAKRQFAAMVRAVLRSRGLWDDEWVTD